MKIFATLFLIGMTYFGIAQNQLIVPGTIEDTDINLTLQTGTHEFFPGYTTATMGVNGNLLGPTLIIHKNDNLNIHVTNALGEPTTVHWHGMHISAQNDGGPHTVIEPDETWNPQFKVMNKASTMWYHPHLDEYTDEHVSKGLAGFIIIKDEEEAALNLPRTYGVDDIPLAVQTKDFDVDYQILHHSNADDVLMVNGTIDAMKDVPAQVIRLRLLNASSQRTFNFGFTDDLVFYQIGTDGGLKEASLELTRLQMSPGERSEILVDLTGMEGQTLHLMSYASELPNGIYGAAYPGMGFGMQLDNYNPNPLNGADFNILQLNVTGQTDNAVTSIPNELVTLTPYLEEDVDEIRMLSLFGITGGPQQLNSDFTINGVSLDLNVINITVPINNTEIWTIQNNTPISHPIHLHDVQFYILDIDGNPPPPSAQGLKDTYLVRSGHHQMRIITKFEDFADDEVPYMYHCHMLKHEDGGMMGQFVVVDTTTVGTKELEEGNQFTLFPNPSNGVYMTAKLNNSNEKITAYAVINELGQIMSYHKIHENEISNLFSFPVFEYSAGTYHLKLYTEERIYTGTFVIER